MEYQNLLLYNFYIYNLTIKLFNKEMHMIYDISEEISDIKILEKNISNFLNNLNLNKESYLKLYKNITETYPYLQADIVDDIIFEDGQSLVVKKTINMLRDKLIHNYSNGFNLDLDIEFIENTLDDAFDNNKNTYHIKRVVFDDLHRVFYKNICDLIKEEDDSDTKEALIQSKYKLMYINSKLDMLNNYSNEYLSSNLYSNYNKVSNFSYNKVKDKFLKDIAIKYLTNLSIYAYEEDMENLDYKIDILLSLSLVKSCITMLSDNAIYELYEFYNDNILEEDNEISYLSLELFNDIDIIENKSKYKILSLRNN